MYLKCFNEKLSEEEARQKAERLVEVYRVVYNMPGVADVPDEKGNKITS